MEIIRLVEKGLGREPFAQPIQATSPLKRLLTKENLANLENAESVYEGEKLTTTTLNENLKLSFRSRSAWPVRDSLLVLAIGWEYGAGGVFYSGGSGSVP